MSRKKLSWVFIATVLVVVILDTTAFSLHVRLIKTGERPRLCG